MIDIEQVRLYRYQLPLRYALPLKGATLSHRQGIIVEVKSGERYGYGEAAPLTDFSVETVEQTEQQLIQLSPSLIRGNVHTESLFPSVQFALSSALWMLKQTRWYSKPAQAPLLQGEINDILQRLKHWSSDWPAEFKLKIGRGSLGADIQRIKTVSDALPEPVQLRLDANQRWTLSEALHIGQHLDSRRIAYIEEPTANPADFPTIYQKTNITFALDETLQSQNYRYRSLEGLAALVIKPSLVGSLERCEEMVSAAQQDGVRTVFSSSFESQVGIHILQQLSAQWSPMELPGLDTVSAFDELLISDINRVGLQWTFNQKYLLYRHCFD